MRQNKLASKLRQFTANTTNKLKILAEKTASKFKTLNKSNKLIAPKMSSVQLRRTLLSQMSVHNSFSLSARSRRKLALSGFFTFIAVFALTYLLGSELMAASSSKATQVAAAVSNTGGYTISLTAAPRLSQVLPVTQDGKAIAMTDKLNVYSTATSGYSVYLSMNTSTSLKTPNIPTMSGLRIPPAMSRQLPTHSTRTRLKLRTPIATI